MTNKRIKRFPARRQNRKRKLKDFLKHHFLKHLPPTPPTPGIAVNMVSCLMVTRGNIGMIRQSLASFNDQTWPERELILVTVNVTDELESLIRSHGQGKVRLIPAPKGLSLGEQRNLTLANSQGEYVCIWDDDDLYSPERVTKSVQALEKAGVDAVFLDRLLLWWPSRGRLAISFSRLWEITMLARRTIVPAYPSIGYSEDAIMVDWLTLHSSYALIDAPELYAYRVTGENQCSDDHFERLFSMSDELSSERAAKLLQSPCFRYADSDPSPEIFAKE